MRKILILFLAVCVMLTLGTTAIFAADIPSSWTYGHVAGDKTLTATYTGNLAYVNPFALVAFGAPKRAILEGDGGLAAFYKGQKEGSIYATGYLPITLYCNCPVQMTATVKGGAFDWEFNNNAAYSNHPNPNGQNNYPYKALPVDLSWDGTNWVKGSDVYGGQTAKDTTITSSKVYDAWTYSENLNFRVNVPIDTPEYTPTSIDELHAGNYKGTIVVTITQLTNTKEGAFALDHTGTKDLY